MPSDTMRLDKLLRTLGLGTRSQVQAVIRAGRVTVDGQIARDSGLLVSPSAAAVTLDGTRLAYQAIHLLMLNMRRVTRLLTTEK